MNTQCRGKVVAAADRNWKQWNFVLDQWTQMTVNGAIAAKDEGGSEVGFVVQALRRHDLNVRDSENFQMATRNVGMEESRGVNKTCGTAVLGCAQLSARFGLCWQLQNTVILSEPAAVGEPKDPKNLARACGSRGFSQKTTKCSPAFWCHLRRLSGSKFFDYYILWFLVSPTTMAGGLLWSSATAK